MSLVQVTESQSIATVTLHRPDLRNAFNPEMISQITKAFRQFSASSGIRAIVLRGSGKVFCAGGDLSWMQEMVNYDFAQNKKDAEILFEMFQAILTCPLPVICVVHGAAFGGALGLIAASDYVICEEKTQLCFSEVKLGIAPAVISTFVLQKSNLGLVGPAMLTGHPFTAADAKIMGLVHDICDEESLNDKILTACQWFRDSGPEAVRATKKLIHEISGASPAQAKDAVTQVIAERRVSAEGQEGLKSFLEKRKPSWRLS
ncbi:MAG: enoyl-CoA hydratase [Oligoflexia bacterium]|nr:MAG: enoyl-CoA hydratase [Oligoflexia bacterium]